MYDFETIVNKHFDGIIIFDDQYKVHYLNFSARLILDKDKAGFNLTDVFKAEDIKLLGESDLVERDVFIEATQKVVLVNSMKNFDQSLSCLTCKDLTIVASIEKDKEIQRARQVEDRKKIIKKSMVSEIAHEINNPLTVLTSQFYGLKKIFDGNLVCDDKGKLLLDKRMQIIQDVIYRIHGVIQSKRDLSEFDFSLEPIDCNLEKSVEKIFKLFDDQIKHAGIKVEIENNLNIDLFFKVDVLKFVLIELIENSIYFTEKLSDRSKWIKVSLVEFSNESVVFSFTDSGDGIVLDDISQIFMPFYTSKLSKEGTGTGLYQVQDLLRLEGGDIDYDLSCENTTFNIKFQSDNLKSIGLS